MRKNDDLIPITPAIAERTDPQLPALVPIEATICDTDPNWPPAPGVLALQQLLKHLGEAETAPNQGPVVEWACRRWCGAEWWNQHYARGQVPWCAGAVSSAFQDAGVPFPGSLSCDALLRLLQRAGWLVWQPPGGHEIQPGDVVFFGPAHDLAHVGLCETCADGRMHTVEGNAGNAVRRRTYSLPDPRLAWVARHP